MEQRIAQAVVLAANQVHRLLGPNMDIAIYRERLCHELALRKIPLVQQRPVLAAYQGRPVDCGYQVDLLVAERLPVELLAVDRLTPLHDVQLLTYMELGGWQAGLLINFNVPILQKGIRWRVLKPAQKPSTLLLSVSSL